MEVELPQEIEEVVEQSKVVVVEEEEKRTDKYEENGNEKDVDDKNNGEKEKGKEKEKETEKEKDEKVVVEKEEEEGTFPLVHLLPSLWSRVVEALRSPLNDHKDLKRVISVISGKDHRVLDYFRGALDVAFFDSVVPMMKELVLRSPELFPSPLPILFGGKEAILTLTREQGACLMSQWFLGCFHSPEFKRPKASYNKGSLSALFCHSNGSLAEFAACISNYFRRVAIQMPKGNLEIRRTVISEHEALFLDSLSTSSSPIPKVHITQSLIETFTSPPNYFHADFANAFIGGGVLVGGAVQEEILFVIKPECLLSLLFCPKMEVNEAIIISGAERFSNYQGYGFSMRFDGDFLDPTPFDPVKGRLRNHVIGIDAHYGAYGQFAPQTILRDVTKCYAGLMRHKDMEEEKEERNAFVTGNWGCGAFGGHKELKAIEQLIAAAAADIDVVYSSFQEVEFAERLARFVSDCAALNVTTGELVRAIVAFEEDNGSRANVFGFVLNKIVTHRASSKQQEPRSPSRSVDDEVPLSDDNASSSTSSSVPAFPLVGGSGETHIQNPIQFGEGQAIANTAVPAEGNTPTT